MGDDAFGRGASGFFLGGGGAFFAEPIHGSIVITAAFGTRLFAIHHARAGLLSEFTNLGYGNFSHIFNFLGANC
jgi:hypothetical protein